MQCNLNMLPLSHRGNRPCGNFHCFDLHGKRKKCKKNKTNTDPNPNITTNPNPKPTIDKAAKRKELKASGKMWICGPADLITCKMRMVTVDFFCGSNK